MKHSPEKRKWKRGAYFARRSGHESEPAPVKITRADGSTKIVTPRPNGRLPKR